MSGKVIYDVIHGYIKVSPLCIKIIDTPEFQRLRHLKQLGLTYLIFPSANHSRFEHSLGVMFLAGEMLKHLKSKQPELNITDREIELVKIAGLCHDLGHGPFSHFFDNYFLKHINYKNEHEDRSCNLLNYIIDTYKIDINELERKQIFNMINPDDNCLKDNRSFLYKIVNNKINGIDVDKFDYIKRDSFFLGMSFGFDSSRIIKQSRVIDGELCFLDKTFYDIQELFEVRDKLHRRVYQHHTNTVLDYMVLDIFKDISGIIDFKSMIDNQNSFYKLDDNFLWRLDHSIVYRLKKRLFYKYLDDFKEKDSGNILSIKENYGDSLIIHNVEFGYDKDMFNEIYFYKFNKDNLKFKKEFKHFEKEKLKRLILIN